MVYYLQQKVQGSCKVGNHKSESGMAKGGKPFDWGYGGCAPDLFSPFPAAEGGKKRPCHSPDRKFATAISM